MADFLFELLQLIMQETALFAAVGFLVLGVSDITVDLIWLCLSARQQLFGSNQPKWIHQLPVPRRSGAMALFIPCWDEAAVIGDMLRGAITTLGESNYRIYVGCYPNDPATIAAVEAVASPRIHLVLGPAPGPTSKADCLNHLWNQMVAEEQIEGHSFKAVVLHDAEDLVDAEELRLFDSMTERFDLVQLPVVPLIRMHSRWVSGTYADEFAEAHGKEMVVRAMLGVGLPSAGVGCAFSREALGDVAAARGLPFDTDSLTEDYELGLRFNEAGRTAAFVRLRADDGRLIATREYFPDTIETAVTQKARWVTGIALSGWDRMGWTGGLAERWMRLRDRQSVIAALLLAFGYFAILSWGLLKLIGNLTGRGIEPFSELFILLALLATFILVWRLTFRFAFVAREYGLREALRSPFRAVIGNAIAILSARRAIGKYLDGRRSGRIVWEKTAHAFPAQIPAE